MNTEEDEFRRIEREAKLRQVPLPAKIYDYEEAYFALKAKRALAVPDPIHHADTCGVEYITGWNDCRQAMLVEQPAQQEPVYHPRQYGDVTGAKEVRTLQAERPWVGLSDEEKHEIEIKAGVTEDDDGYIVSQMFRLIEAKLKEKNT